MKKVLENHDIEKECIYLLEVGQSCGITIEQVKKIILTKKELVKLIEGLKND